MWAIVIYMHLTSGEIVVTSISPAPSEKVCRQYVQAVTKNLMIQESQTLIECRDLATDPLPLKLLH